jgi:hypothetical protein
MGAVNSGGNIKARWKLAQKNPAKSGAIFKTGSPTSTGPPNVAGGFGVDFMAKGQSFAFWGIIMYYAIVLLNKR